MLQNAVLRLLFPAGTMFFSRLFFLVCPASRFSAVLGERNSKSEVDQESFLVPGSDSEKPLPVPKYPSSAAYFVATTVSSEAEAEALSKGRAGIERVSREQVRSYYWWQGKAFAGEQELRVTFRTSGISSTTDLRNQLLQKHPYDTPMMLDWHEGGDGTSDAPHSSRKPSRPLGDIEAACADYVAKETNTKTHLPDDITLVEKRDQAVAATPTRRGNSQVEQTQRRRETNSTTTMLDRSVALIVQVRVSLQPTDRQDRTSHMQREEEVLETLARTAVLKRRIAACAQVGKQSAWLKTALRRSADPGGQCALVSKIVDLAKKQGFHDDDIEFSLVHANPSYATWVTENTPG
ncbi:unnamed protein product [Amoebophrya sp. A25]|nr:unnamed protein product [Amoebophrya sp. A25]|eukprot:GSA25T00018771001.1